MNASAASTNDWTMAHDWTIISSLRLSERSATRPAQGPMTQHRPNWQAARMPRAMPLSVRCSTSSVWATIVSQLPIWEIELADEEQAEVADLQRRERLLRLGRHAHPGLGQPFQHVEGVGEPAASSASSATHLLGEPVAAALAVVVEQRPPSALMLTPADAAVVAVDLAGDQPVVFELGHDLGDRGRGHPLDRGELAEGQRALAVRSCPARPHRRRERTFVPLPQVARQSGGWRARAGPPDP